MKTTCYPKRANRKFLPSVVFAVVGYSPPLLHNHHKLTSLVPLQNRCITLHIAFSIPSKCRRAFKVRACAYLYSYSPLFLPSRVCGLQGRSESTDWLSLRLTLWSLGLSTVRLSRAVSVSVSLWGSGLLAAREEQGYMEDCGICNRWLWQVQSYTIMAFLADLQ